MHLAVATGRRTVAIFGPTCAQEIDLFGRGEKIVSPIDCAPCYLRACDKAPHCQDMIPAARVLEALLRQLTAA
jgi:heptosyltransferase-2